jgi:hypothetical protein
MFEFFYLTPSTNVGNVQFGSQTSIFHSTNHYLSNWSRTKYAILCRMKMKLMYNSSVHYFVSISKLFTIVYSWTAWRAAECLMKAFLPHLVTAVTLEPKETNMLFKQTAKIKNVPSYKILLLPKYPICTNTKSNLVVHCKIWQGHLQRMYVSIKTK